MKKLLLALVLAIVAIPAFADVAFPGEDFYDFKRKAEGLIAKCPRTAPLYRNGKCYPCDWPLDLSWEPNLGTCEEICPNREGLYDRGYRPCRLREAPSPDYVYARGYGYVLRCPSGQVRDIKTGHCRPCDEIPHGGIYAAETECLSCPNTKHDLNWSVDVCYTPCSTNSPYCREGMNHGQAPNLSEPKEGVINPSAGNIPLFVFLYPMLLTALIEVFVLWCFKYRKRAVLIYFAILNLISNFIVNVLRAGFWVWGAWFFSFLLCEILGTDIYYCNKMPEWICIPFLELGAVLFEFILLGIKAGYSKKLLFVVFICNLISFLTGVILFGL